MSSVMQDRSVYLEPYFKIEIGGLVIPPEQHQYITDITSEDAEDKLDLVQIKISDVDFWFLNNEQIVTDAGIIVWMGHRQNFRKMLDGKITHVEVSGDANGIPTVSIGCIDAGVDLNWDRKGAYTWWNTKITTIVQQIVGMYGFYCEVDVDPIGVLESFSRGEQETDLEFIKRWADALGWKFFRKPDGNYYFGARNMEEVSIAQLNYYQGDCSIIDFSLTYMKKEKDGKRTDSDINDAGTDTTSTKQDGVDILTPDDYINGVNVAGTDGTVTIQNREARE
jgi:hypothetical protein